MSHKHNRRKFLQQSAGVAAVGAAAPYFFAARARGKEAASDRPLVGQIGCGGQGNSITRRATAFGDVAAVCDVDEKHAAAAKAKQGKGKADTYGDYRKLLDRKDIDVVTIATPDHWHTKIAIEAMQAGKDVYCEKPLTLTIDEGKLICKAVKETGKVFQVGTQQRSHGAFAQAVALCREGRLGKLQKITVAIGTGPQGGPFKKQAPPAHLDWEMWQGQTPLVEYIPKRCHHEFRYWLEYSGGKMTDWGAHHVDIAHWANGADDTSPVSYEGRGEFPVPLKDGYPTYDDRYNTATKFEIHAKFDNGVALTITDRTPDFDNGLLIEGDKGRIFVNRGKLTGAPVEELKDKPLPEDALGKLLKGHAHGNHMGNFFHCVKTRQTPISDVFSHHRAITTCHLANICIRLGRPLKWNPKTQQIVGDDEAGGFLRREQRKGYEITL